MSLIGLTNLAILRPVHDPGDERQHYEEYMTIGDHSSVADKEAFMVTYRELLRRGYNPMIVKLVPVEITAALDMPAAVEPDTEGDTE